LGRARLRWPGRARRRRAAPRRSRCRARGDRRRRLPRQPLRSRPARPGPADPHVGRAPHLQLPALAARVLRARLRGHALAGLRPFGARGGSRRLRPPAPPLRRQMNPFVSRLVVAAVGLPAALGLVWLGGWWLWLLAAAAGLVALHEFYGMARPLRPLVLAGYAGMLLLLLGAQLGGAIWMLGGFLTTIVFAFLLK